MFNKIISDDELKDFGSISNFSEKAEALLNHQKLNWELVKNNFDALDSVKSKIYKIDGLEIKTQFNPSRIISSSAKVDKESIKNRKCFLCIENLPEVQRGVRYSNDYIFLCNPYPIFKQHLTIPNINHIPQAIDEAFSELLNLAHDLKDNFFVFYNGPNCGASAPDHLHFQAAIKNSTPLESYFKELVNYDNSLYRDSEIVINTIDKTLFKIIHISSSNETIITEKFKAILNLLEDYNSSYEEPLLNIISFYEEDRWNLFIVPRKQHRPNQFFLEGDEKLLISPASVDMMGLLITPREEDFERLTEEDIIDIYTQVLFDQTNFDKLCDSITMLDTSYS